MSGPAGAGRSTAIGALEDLGFEAIDNLPISFLPRLFAGGAGERPVVIGIDPRNRDFSVDRMLAALGEVEEAAGRAPVLVYLDCDAVTLARRYSETRRRHPLSPHETAAIGIERELALLAPLRERADVLIDTRAMTPHELRAEMGRQFGEEKAASGGLAVTLQSFSYKRGVPRGSDMVIDVRFLKNPHWDQALRPLDGRDRGGARLRGGGSGLCAVLRAAGGSAEVPASGVSGGRKELFRPRARLHGRPAPLGGRGRGTGENACRRRVAGIYSPS